jgi:hypothetical protein
MVWDISAELMSSREISRADRFRHDNGSPWDRATKACKLDEAHGGQDGERVLGVDGLLSDRLEQIVKGDRQLRRR